MLVYIMLYEFLKHGMLCSKYEYLLFENFDIVRNTFIFEQLRVVRLRELLKTKTSDMVVLSESLYNSSVDPEKEIFFRKYLISSDKFSISINTAKILGHSYSIRRMEKSYHNNKTNVIPIHDEYIQSISGISIIKAAQNGLIILHETYGIDIEQFSNGIFRTNTNDIRRRSDALHPGDFASMALITLDEFGWYHNSALYLNESVSRHAKLFQNNTRNLRSNSSLTLAKRKQIVNHIHNRLLARMQKYIASNRNLYPSSVQTGNT